VFVLGNAGDNTAIIGIAVGVSAGLLCIAAVVIAILFYCYKVKKRYTF